MRRILTKFNLISRLRAMKKAGNLENSGSPATLANEWSLYRVAEILKR
jgi:hypothetical protein